MLAWQLAPEQWSCGERVGVMAVTLTVAMLCRPVFRACNRVMKETGGVGIFGLELIGSQERATPVLARWGGGPGWRAARWSLVIDFAFLAAYGLGLWTLAAVVASHAETRNWDWWANAIRVMGWGFVLAAVLDFIENVALLSLLYESAVDAMAKIAWTSAVIKFFCLIVGALLVLTTVVAFVGP